MSDPSTSAQRRVDPKAAGGVALVAVIMAVVLVAMGRVLWCKCGSPVPWSFDTWSMHNSQHIVDPYALSHMLHGVVFFWALKALSRGRWAGARWVVAALVEAGWEILENTPLVIDRYRENTASLDYVGDSVANSLADLAFCLLGYGAAAMGPLWASVAGFALLEVVSMLWIRDGLVLNVIMLLYPLDAIKQWQMGG